MDNIKIRISNVYKVFGEDPDRAIALAQKGASKEEILKKAKAVIGVFDVSFDVYDGETLVVMGLSGSGKSTLLRCVNRLHEPTRGSIQIDEEEVTTLSRKDLLTLRQKKFGMVFQRFALFPHRTVRDNAAYGLEIQKVPAEERKKRADEALALVGLAEWADSYPEQLSGGMQQRVGLARALAVDPDILVMDEAFSALDPLIRTEMQDELLALESKVKKTILFVTHDLDEALRIGDRIVLMKDGAVVQIGTPEEILGSPATEYVRKFVENVDISKVLTARDVMVKAATVLRKDGPHVALRRMKEIGIPRMLVVDKDKKFIGIVVGKRVAAAIDAGNNDLCSVCEAEKDVAVVTPDMPLQELLPLVVDIEHPVVVLDEDQRVMGIVVESSILAALADRKRN